MPSMTNTRRKNADLKPATVVKKPDHGNKVIAAQNERYLRKRDQHYANLSENIKKLPDQHQANFQLNTHNMILSLLAISAVGSGLQPALPAPQVVNNVTQAPLIKPSFLAGSSTTTPILQNNDLPPSPFRMRLP